MPSRFGPVPRWLEARLTEAPEAELDALADTVIEAASLEVLFPERSKEH